MTRERLLFVAVLGIVALWFLVMREEPALARNPVPGRVELDPLPVKDVTSRARSLKLAGNGPFTLVTNEDPHPRPTLPLPRASRLHNIWPPTSRSVGLSLLGRLRRPAARPQEGDATIQLPDLAATGAAGAPDAVKDERKDEWTGLAGVAEGRVIAVKRNGKWVRDPGKLPAVGPLAAGDFFRLLVLLEIDPARATQEGVTHAEVRLEAGPIRLAFPAEVNNLRICVEGKQKGYLDALKAYLKLPDVGGVAVRIARGRALLEQGKGGNDNAALRWSIVILEEARARVPASDRRTLREILLLELAASNALHDHERLLRLAFTHLASFPNEADVLEHVGTLLASRSYDVPEQAKDWFAQARNSKSAQVKRVAVLIRLGQFKEARALLQRGLAGTGAPVDLLWGRVALALGDLETARSKARIHAGESGEAGAEANLILGGAAYAEGGAAAAEEFFSKAVEAEPDRSTCYSDLGLALAVQGKTADAIACFERAAGMDFENTVIPGIGRAFLMLNAGDTEGAAAILSDPRDGLEEYNPGDLLVRYFAGYAKELAGDAAGAAAAYRSVLDNDHRYRIAIARLGVVQAGRAEAGGDAQLVKEAVAHLRKATALNPTDPRLPYILARFQMGRGNPATRRESDDLFSATQGLAPPADDRNLPLWAEAARASLLYRDDAVDELQVKARFNRVITHVKDQVRRTDPTDIQKALEAHPVYRYAKSCLDMISENESKVDVEWRFLSKPRDWKTHAVSPMQINFNRERGVKFHGQVDFKGQQRDFTNILKQCAIDYENSNVNGNAFYEATFRGEIPSGTLVDLGIGIVTKSGRRRMGPTGIQVRRRQNNGTMEVRLEGGEHDLFKRMKARDFIEMTKVPWPAGAFELRIKVTDREKGRFALFLQAGENPEVNVFSAQIDQDHERCAIFGKGSRGSRPLQFHVWVEGNDGDRYDNIYLSKVTLTKSK